MARDHPASTRKLIQWGGHRILYNPSRLTTISLEWFDPAFWSMRDLVQRRFEGRGQALAIATPTGPAVLRRFLRGGWVSRLVRDRYLYLGPFRSRAFREYDLLRALFEQGLPVPEPLAALCDRRGLTYRAALITGEIPGARTLASLAAGLQDEDWHALRLTLDQFFAAGLKHPDLNAKNILRDQRGNWYLIDFDRARQAARRSDPAPMLRRLQRSLHRLGLPAAPW
jgi:3-deoxy-D-manno-octulosonic acid kinase